MILFILICLFTALLQNVDAECPAIISKNEWDGAKPKHRQYLSTPLDLVIIQHTVTQLCNNDQSCLATVKDIQRIHQDEAFLWDIGPSFLIANTGKIYEGRGWNHVPVHTVGYNNQSFGIAFIGTFNNQEPSLQALDSSKALIACGVELGRLTPNHKVVLQKQLIPTESPGKKLTSKIMSWPNWIRDVTEITKRILNKEVNNLLHTPVDQTLPSTEIKTTIKTTKIYILSTPKEIDQLWDKRDVIAELINSIHRLARQTLDTLETIAKAITGQFNLFIEGIIHGLRTHKDRINAAGRIASVIPSVAQCSKQIQQRAYIFYDDTELTIKKCTENRVNEVYNMIENLSTLSKNVIDNANIAVKDTKNCTELNFGIKLPTEACLNSITRRTQSLAQDYESQTIVASVGTGVGCVADLEGIHKNICWLDITQRPSKGMDIPRGNPRLLIIRDHEQAVCLRFKINNIRNAAEPLPEAYNRCVQKLISEASTQTEEMVLQFSNCKPSWGIPFSFPGFN